jgi:hypothetical protein
VTTVKFSHPTGSTLVEPVVAGAYSQVLVMDGTLYGLNAEGVIEHLADVVKIADGNGVGWKFRSRAYRKVTFTSDGPTYLTPFTKRPVP